MDDRTFRLAMLGDRDAQEALTERGVLISCPCCKGRAVVVEGTFRNSGKYSVTCGMCFLSTVWCTSRKDAIERWNTRAPLLSAEELEAIK